MPRPVDEQTTKERRGQFFTTSADVQEAIESISAIYTLHASES